MYNLSVTLYSPRAPKRLRFPETITRAPQPAILLQSTTRPYDRSRVVPSACAARETLKGSRSRFPHRSCSPSLFFYIYIFIIIFSFHSFSSSIPRGRFVKALMATESEKDHESHLILTAKTCFIAWRRGEAPLLKRVAWNTLVSCEQTRLRYFSSFLPLREEFFSWVIDPQRYYQMTCIN